MKTVKHAARAAMAHDDARAWWMAWLAAATLVLVAALAA